MWLSIRRAWTHLIFHVWLWQGPQKASDCIGNALEGAFDRSRVFRGLEVGLQCPLSLRYVEGAPMVSCGGTEVVQGHDALAPGRLSIVIRGFHSNRTSPPADLQVRQVAPCAWQVQQA